MSLKHIEVSSQLFFMGSCRFGKFYYVPNSPRSGRARQKKNQNCMNTNRSVHFSLFCADENFWNFSGKTVRFFRLFSALLKLNRKNFQGRDGMWPIESFPKNN